MRIPFEAPGRLVLLAVCSAAALGPNDLRFAVLVSADAE